MRAAIADGSVELLLDWKAVEAGDFFFVPAGTVHAIGAGITLVEVQQNADVTYRLYDYGRPRELHLQQGMEVSRLVPYERKPIHVAMGDSQTLLPSGVAPFRLEMFSWQPGSPVRPEPATLCWFIPLKGSGSIDGEPFLEGECWLIDPAAEIMGREAGTALIAYSDKPSANER
jgi:mannose-6-phosphate isomerase